MQSCWKMYPYDMEQPALLLFDSLKLNDAAATTKIVQEWLNHEWDKSIALKILKFSMNSSSGCFNLEVMDE
jgi:hypothetical protein